MIITRLTYATTISTSAATVQQERTRTVVSGSPSGVLREVQTIETSPASSAAGANEVVDTSASYEGTNVVAGLSGVLTLSWSPLTTAGSFHTVQYSVNGGTPADVSASTTVDVNENDVITITYGVGGASSMDFTITAADLADGVVAISIHQFTGPAKS